jgi:hypothetical protein
VALKDDVSIAQWRMNEAHYALILQERLLDASYLQFFYNATMLSLEYPSKHSAILILQERLLDASYLKFFDSATMLSLKYPSKHSAIRFCQQPGDYLEDNLVQDVCGHLEGGHGYDPFIDNVPIDDLFVGKSQAGEHAGRGVFTKVDIPSNTYVGLETSVHSILFEWTTTDLHNEMMDLFWYTPMVGARSFTSLLKHMDILKNRGICPKMPSCLIC